MILLGYAATVSPSTTNTATPTPRTPKSPLKKLRPSFSLKKGARPAGSPGGSYDGTFTVDYQYVAGSGDLDDSNGRFEVTTEYPAGIYHYSLSNRFPMSRAVFTARRTQPSCRPVPDRAAPEDCAAHPAPPPFGPPPRGGPPPPLPPGFRPPP